ncbi:MAG: 1-acyl-sn-glycerol-3-phosphate acyltransferase [Spirochaetes bacterium]|nr:1-acyl-sn-glycerol-3-phosphate acyltransferase [Spirochaetota bacterium]
MTLFLLKLTSFFRLIGILFSIALAAVLSIPSAIINRSGYLGHIFAKMGGRLILFFAGVKVHCKGIENIDKTKTQVFAINHLSYFDVPVIYSILPVQVGWLAKKDLFRLPFLGWLMRANKFIPVEEGEGRKVVESLNSAVEKVRSGTRIVIFPEGTRSMNGELQPFKKLLFRLCVKTGVPIVPIYIKGTNEALTRGSLLIRPGNVYANIGKEIETSQYQPNKVLDLMDDFKNSIIKLSEELINNRSK